MWSVEFDKISEAVRNRSLELDCSRIELRSNDNDASCSVQGPGVIRMVEERLVFKMFANAEVPAQLPGVKTGELIPKQHFWQLVAVDMKGRRWACDNILPESNISSSRCDPPGIVVTGNLWQIEGRFDQPLPQAGCVTIDIPGDFRVPLRGVTKMVSTNKTTGLQLSSSKLDSMSLRAGGSEITVEKHSEFLRFNVLAQQPPPAVEIRISEAFQFVTARPTWWEVCRFSSHNDEYVRIRPRERLSREPHFQPPFKTISHEDFWKLFAKYYEFVLRKQSVRAWHPISAFIEEICEASAGSVSLHGLVLAVAIEGIVEFATPEQGQAPESFTKVVSQLHNYMSKWPGFNEDSHGDGLSAEERSVMKNRALGTLSQLTSVRAKDRLLALEELGVIDRSLITNWQQLRNASAHGKSSMGLPTQDELDRIDKAQALLYRLIFHAIGYSGSFTDYGQQGWPQAVFP